MMNNKISIVVKEGIEGLPECLAGWREVYVVFDRNVSEVVEDIVSHCREVKGSLEIVATEEENLQHREPCPGEEGILLQDSASKPSNRAAAGRWDVKSRIEVFMVQRVCSRTVAADGKTMQKERKKSKETEKDHTANRNCRFLLQAPIKFHEAIAVTAIAPLLNLNLNYEKLHVKYTVFFVNNNYSIRIFAYFNSNIFSPYSSKTIFAFRSGTFPVISRILPKPKRLCSIL